MVRSGDSDQAHPDFLDGRICLGWSRLGDLSLIGNDRRAFLVAYRKHYRDEDLPAARLIAGELYRFVHKMSLRDFVIYPARTDGLVRVGRVRGSYEHRPRQNQRYPHTRLVDWLSTVRRKSLPLDVRLAIGRRSTLYQPRQDSDEVRAALLP